MPSSGIWYVDSGASRHMTGVREYFPELSESGTDIEVVLGDDRVVRVVGVRTLVKISHFPPWFSVSPYFSHIVKCPFPYP